MAAFCSSVFSTTSFESDDIQRCICVAEEDDVRILRRRSADVLMETTDAVVVVATRGAHATATLRADCDACRRNRAATILHKQRL
jgi:hypothetical protein